MLKKQRTILISGASRGIGRSIAERLLKSGHRVSLGLRNPDKLIGTNLDPNINDNIVVNYYEATEEETAINWVKNTIDKFKTFDSVINCAGVFNSTEFIFAPSERKDIDHLWNVNVMGPWLLCKASWNEIKRSNDGRIITLVSMSGKRSKGKLAGYSTSKFALMGLCQTIRNEGWKDNIRVTAICPGWVNTEMASGVESIAKEEMTQPNDLAEIINSLLMLPKNCVPFEVLINCLLESTQ